jgi:hypothetical protein
MQSKATVAQTKGRKQTTLACFDIRKLDPSNPADKEELLRRQVYKEMAARNFKIEQAGKAKLRQLRVEALAREIATRN